MKKDEIVRLPPEIALKGKEARFVKTERERFAAKG